MRGCLFVLWLFVWLLFGACASAPSPYQSKTREDANPDCRRLAAQPLADEPLAALDRFSDLASSNCHHEAIAIGRWIREHYRDKTYSIMTETASLFMPEDLMTDYVLESYERSYLTFLLAQEELKVGNIDGARVELRRDEREGRAMIYNFGGDPVNALLIAALWDSVNEPELARPFWKRVGESTELGETTSTFALSQLERIDRGERRQWRITPLETLPELNWEMNDGKTKRTGIYTILPRCSLPTSCAVQDVAVRISTSPWVEKIALRHDADYHPLLHAKTWVRAPIGIVYGLSVFSAGVAVGVGGCVLAAHSSNGGGELCRASIEAGGYLVQHAAPLTEYVIRPDLRHWRKVPAGFHLTQDRDGALDSCHPLLTSLDKP